jgi:hypothetical protein
VENPSTLFLKNQFGEQSNNYNLGGTSRLWANFVVDSANGNGLGLRSLKSNCLASAFMHTSASPLAGNPNPIAGLIILNFSAPFSGYNTGTFGFVAPISGTPINVTSGLTLGHAYIITSVGTTTPAQWQALGLPTNVVPAVGASFVAITASAGSGTGVVETQLAGGAGVDHLEIIGDPNTSVVTNNTSGGQMILQAMKNTALTAPNDNTVIGFTFDMGSFPAPLI